MADAPLRLTPDLPAAWPASVRATVATWQADLAAAASGRVFELTGADAHRLVDRLGQGEDDERAGTYDTVVSVAGLIHHADLVQAVRGVRRLLAPGGEFRFAEPVEVPGWRGLAMASLTSRGRAARGVHLSRDVALAIRSVGMLICDLDRQLIPTPVWPLRRWAVGRAVVHHPIPGGAS